MKIKTILIHFFLLLPTNIQLQQPLHCYAEFRALQNNRIENLKCISKTYIESTWQQDVELQCRKSIASFSLMETDNDRQICAQFLWCMPAFIFAFFNGSNNNNNYNNNGPSMQAGTVAGLKCILRIRRVHWRKLGFVLLYYFAFTYVCVNTQSHTQQTDWLALTILLTQRKRLAVKAVAIFMRTFISGRAASA